MGIVWAAAGSVAWSCGDSCAISVRVPPRWLAGDGSTAAACEALRPVAEAVAVAAAGIADVRWWTEPVDRGCQRYTQFLDQRPLPEPVLTGAAESAGAWLADTRDDEPSAHDRPEDPTPSGADRCGSRLGLPRLPDTTPGLPE